MNFFKKTLIGSALLSAMVTATALPVTDVVNPDPDSSIASTYTFTHDITDGYTAGLDAVTSAWLSIHLVDFENKKKETFSFLIGSDGASQFYDGSKLNNGSKGAYFDIALVAALSDLAADGRLEVTLSAQAGDYAFADSTLTAEITRGAGVTAVAITAVPEPASLALFSIGLLGLAVRRRSR